MPAVEVWFQDGPVDGRVMAVETMASEQLPESVRLPETGVYVGTSDIPAPPVEHLYVRANGPDGELIYQYCRSIEVR